MKIYMLSSGFGFTLIAWLTEKIMSTQQGYLVYSGFNWFAGSASLSFSNIAVNFGLGLVLSLVAAVYMNFKSMAADGLRFGLIIGLVTELAILFNMLIHINDGMYHFLAGSLMVLVGIHLTGFLLSGCLFGIMFKWVDRNDDSQMPFGAFS